MNLSAIVFEVAVSILARKQKQKQKQKQSKQEIRKPQRFQLKAIPKVPCASDYIAASPIDINVPTRSTLVLETKDSFVSPVKDLNNKNNVCHQ